jgi:hypothetical protein
MTQYYKFFETQDDFYTTLDTKDSIRFLSNRSDYILYETINLTKSGDDFISLEWMEVEHSGVLGCFQDEYIKPYYSPIANLDQSSKNSIFSAKSDFVAYNRNLQSIYSKKLDELAIYFPNSFEIVPISSYSTNQLNMSIEQNILYENYRVIYSSYAITLIGDELYFCYDYQPWSGDSMLLAKKSLLLDEVNSIDIDIVDGSYFIEISRGDSFDIDFKSKLF